MWYFKGRRKKYKSPYTGKEVDAAVARGGKLPIVTSADAGKVLTVNDEGKYELTEAGLPEVSVADDGKMLQVNEFGKWVAINYPIDTNETVIFNEQVTISEGYHELSITLSGEYTDYIVKMNNVSLTYRSGEWPGYYGTDSETGNEYQVYTSSEVVAITGCAVYDAVHDEYLDGTFSLKISGNQTTIDANFESGVDAIVNNRLLPEPSVENAGKIAAISQDGNWALSNHFKPEYQNIEIVANSSHVITGITAISTSLTPVDITLEEAIDAFITKRCKAGRLVDGSVELGFYELLLNSHTGNIVQFGSYFLRQVQTTLYLTASKIEFNISANTATIVFKEKNAILS